MYKVLIVEDEKNARDGLAELIRNFDSEIQVIVRSNGLDGYQEALRQLPDIVISDIKMPRLDGISMAKKLHQKHFSGKIFLLTGYAEFSYAQQAIHYGVAEYILKPITPDDFLPLLKRTLESISREKLISGQKNPHIAYLFSDKDDAALKEQLSFRNYTDCFFAAVYISGGSHLPAKMKDILLREPNLFLVYLPDKQFRGLCIGFRENTVNHTAIAKLNALLKEFKELVCIYTITPLYSLESPEVLFQKLQKSVIWSITYSSRFLNYTSTMEKAPDPYKEDAFLKSRLQKLQCEQSYQAYGALLMEHIEKMRKKQIHPINIRMTAVTYLIKIGSDQHYFHTAERLTNAKTIHEITTCIRTYFSQQPDSNMEQYSSIVRQAILEIQKNYQNPISLNSTAQKLKVTPQYLSRLFNQETEYTFVNYLTEYRIEKAKFLLQHSDIKINVLCQKVGYPDPKYFCTLFKKTTGVTPNQYRNSHSR